MSVTSIHSSTFSSVASMLISSIKPPTGAISGVVRGLQAVVFVHNALWNTFLNRDPHPPPPLLPPLPPPPTRVLEPFGPYIMSRTTSFPSPAPGGRCHSPSTLSVDNLIPQRSLLVFGMVFSVIVLMGLAIALHLVISRATRRVSPKARSTSFGKPGVMSPSVQSTRFTSTLGTLIRIVAMSCCFYGVIHFVLRPTLGVRLAFNPRAGIMLVDVESTVTVYSLHHIFDAFKNSVGEVVGEWIREQGSAYLKTAVAASKEIIDALTFAATGATSDLVLRETVRCNGAAFDMATETCVFPDAISLDFIRRLRDMIHTTVTAVLAKPEFDIERFLSRTEAMASYVYEVLRFVSLPPLPSTLAPAVPFFIRGVDILLDAFAKAATPLVKCIQYIPLPNLGDLLLVLIGIGFVVNFTSAAFQVIRNSLYGKFSQYTRIAVAQVSAPWLNVEPVSVLAMAFTRVTTSLRTYVGSVPRVASLATSVGLDAVLADNSIRPPHVDAMSLVTSCPSTPDRIVDSTVSPLSSDSTGSCSEASVGLTSFVYIAKNVKAPMEKQRKNALELRIDTTSIVKSVHDDLTASSYSGPSFSDSTSDFSRELTPATSVPDVSLASEDIKLVVPVPSSRQIEVVDRLAVASSASSPATAPLIAPVENEREWTVVTYKKPKRRTHDHDLHQADTPIVPRDPRPRPQALLQTRPQGGPPKPASPAPSCGPSEAIASHVAPKSSKLSLGSLRSNQTSSSGSVWSLPKPANASSNSAMDSPWFTVNVEPATASPMGCLNEAWFPRLPSRKSSPSSPLSGVQEPDAQRSKLLDRAAEEHAEDCYQSVAEVSDPYSYDEHGNFPQTMEPIDLFAQEDRQPVARLPPSSAYGGKTFAALSREDLHDARSFPPETRSQMDLENLFAPTQAGIVVNIPRSTFPSRI
ncbi:hypothetical protein BD410DRAFT_900866 [Rickenella mellea]|uniref:Uncharacterized protein n=1 Tax=Rickenella mellea TaxID=50990 RepID=A0A4Y7PTC3_9AGAM|nr:hypothetical protein BD410DRAFT_900866 [Rickenella mellea]